MIPEAVYKNLRKPKAQGEEPRLSISGIVTMKVRGLTEYQEPLMPGTRTTTELAVSSGCDKNK